MVATGPDYIAEIGINHNGCLDTAKYLVERAADSGATVAKFQTYITSSRVEATSPIFDLLTACELPFSAFEELKSFTESCGLIFSSTPFCIESSEFLASIQTQYIKIASFHFSNKRLINHILGKQDSFAKLILSTGLSTPCTIRETHDLICSILGLELTREKVQYLHCISQYPVSNEADYNLRNISLIKKMTGCVVGYSDHTIGHRAAELAISLGAQTIEKHFTNDTSQTGADHHMSSTPAAFRELVDACNSVVIMLGTERTSRNYDCELPIMPYNVTTSIP